MSSLTDTAEDRVLNWLTGNAVTAPVLPLKARLVTILGTDAAAGTEVVGGTYTPQTSTFAAAAGGTGTTNTGVIRYDGLPACTVVGVEVWDSAGVPVRWLHGPLAANKTVAAGDSLEFAAGELDLIAA
jgi:hypothetical protein